MSGHYIVLLTYNNAQGVNRVNKHNCLIGNMKFHVAPPKIIALGGNLPCTDTGTVWADPFAVLADIVLNLSAAGLVFGCFSFGVRSGALYVNAG